jgi:hypothetical protein
MKTISLKIKREQDAIKVIIIIIIKIISKDDQANPSCPTSQDSSYAPSPLKHFHRILNDRKKEIEAFKGNIVFN